jgi:hypothetical protein
MKMGIGIGWPNSTSEPVILRSGWFRLGQICTGGTVTNGWTEFVTDVPWEINQYIYLSNFTSRVRLEEFSSTDPAAPFSYPATGPAYNSCGI